MNKLEERNKLYIEKLKDQNVKYVREYFESLYDEMQNRNIVLIGLRQIGKTTILEQLISRFFKHGLKEDININNLVYLNLKAINGIWDAVDINIFITKKRPKVIVLDEIQEIDNWSNFIQSLADLNPNSRILVSGSNARALKDEIMLGRAKTIYIKPLFFNEYKIIWANTNLDTYLESGTFPKPQYQIPSKLFYNECIEEQVIDKIVFNDLKELRVDINKFKLTLKSIANFIGNEVVSSALFANEEVARQTVSTYLKLMVESRLIRRISKYMDKSSKPLSKVYFEDHCMINWFTEYDKNNHRTGAQVENVIFSYLDRKYNSKYSFERIFYFKPKKEIDFIVPSAKLLIESKHVSDLNVKALSIELNEIIKNYNFENYTKIVITKNDDFEINGWKFISLQKFVESEYLNLPEAE